MEMNDFQDTVLEYKHEDIVCSSHVRSSTNSSYIKRTQLDWEPKEQRSLSNCCSRDGDLRYKLLYKDKTQTQHSEKIKSVVFKNILDNAYELKMEKQRSFEDKQSPRSESESTRKNKKETKGKKKDGEMASKKKHKEESNSCVIPALRLLIALEDYLGSINKGLMGLLTEALRMEKDKLGSSNDLLAQERTILIIETAKQKLKGGLEAELITGRAIKAAKKAIARARALLKKVKAQASQQKEAVISRPPVEECQRVVISPKLDALLDTNATDLLDLISDTIPDNIIATLTGDSPEDTPKMCTNSRTDNSIAEDVFVDTPLNGIYISMNVTNFFQDNQLTDEQLFSLLNRFETLPSVEQIDLVKYLATLEPSRVDKLKAALTMAVARYDCLSLNAVSHVTPTTSAYNPILVEHQDTLPCTKDQLEMHATSFHQDRTKCTADLLHNAGPSWNCGDNAEHPTLNETDHIIAEAGSVSAKDSSVQDSYDSDVEIVVPMPKIQIKEEDEHVVSSEGLRREDFKKVIFKVKSLETQPVNSMSDKLLTTNDEYNWSDDDFTDKMVTKKKRSLDGESETEENKNKSINSISLKKLEITKLLESVVDPIKAEKIYEMLRECSNDVEEQSAVSSTTDIATINQSGEQSLVQVDVGALRPHCVLCQSKTHKLRDCILRNKHLCMVCQTYGYRRPNCPECSVSRQQKNRKNSERVRISSGVDSSWHKHRNSTDKTRYFQNYSSYRYQRSAARYQITADRYRRSPEERRRSISPYKRKQNKSPTERRRSRSSNRFRSRSPTEHRRSRSSNRFRSNSPSERRRSRSLNRLRRRSLTERRRSRSSKRLGSRSPTDRRRSRSYRLRSRSSTERRRSRSASRLRSRSNMRNRSQSQNSHKKSRSPDERRRTRTPRKIRSRSPNTYRKSPSQEKLRTKTEKRTIVRQSKEQNDILVKCNKKSDIIRISPNKYPKSGTPNTNQNSLEKELTYSNTHQRTLNRLEETIISYNEQHTLTRGRLELDKVIFCHKESETQALTKPERIQKGTTLVLEQKESNECKQRPKKCDTLISNSDVIDISSNDVQEEIITSISFLDSGTVLGKCGRACSTNSRCCVCVEAQNAIKMLIDPNKLTPNQSDIALSTPEDISGTVDIFNSNNLVVLNSDAFDKKTEKRLNVVTGCEPAKQKGASDVTHDKDNISIHLEHDLKDNKVPGNDKYVSKDAVNNPGYKIDIRISSLKNITTETITKVTPLGNAESNECDKIIQKNESIQVSNLIVCETREQENVKKTMNTAKTLDATKRSESVESNQKCLNSHVRNVANLIVCETKENNTEKSTTKSIKTVNLDIVKKTDSCKSHKECQENDVACVNNLIVPKTVEKSSVNLNSRRPNRKRKIQRNDVFCPRCRVDTHTLKACQAGRKIVCFRCGMDGVRRSECPSCKKISKVKSFAILDLELASHTFTDVMGKTTLKGDSDIK